MKKTRFGVLFALLSVVCTTMLGINVKSSNESNEIPRIYARPFETIKEPYSYSDSLTNEPKYSNQFHLKHINIGTTWNSYRGEGVTVAVIDSGINYLHEDFKDRNGKSIISELSAVSEEISWPRYKMTSVKDSGGDFSILQDDAEGHGTNVAATIAAAVNGKGTAGVAPNVNLMFLKTDYSFVSINQCIDYAVDNGADIINMSFGAYVNNAYNEDTGKLEDEGQGASVATDMVASLNRAYNAGVVLIAAAGNENTAEKSYPACNDHVISVGALARNSSTSLASYSNHGANVDIVAPGTVYVADVGNPVGQSSAYTETQGTSFASPLVAGCVALMMSKYPDMTNDKVEQRILQTAYDLGEAGVDRDFGYGRIDVTRMMTIPVTGVSLSKESLVMKPGETYQLEATIEPSNADNQDKIFISNNEDIATVDMDTGLVTAVGVGKTEVGVLTDDGNYTAYCDVYVSSDGQVSVESVSLNKNSTTLKVGESETLVPTITPSYATNTDYTWSTSDSRVATVNNGVVKGVGDGVATITVSVGGKSAACEVTVRDGKAKSITVSPATKTVNLNKQTQFYATVGPEDADDKTVTWSSSSPSVATIDAKTGMATSLAEGTTTITATANDGSGVKGTAELIVSSKAISYAYEKVTSNLSDYTGQFLFVYEIKKEVFNGNLDILDATNNVLTGITITNNMIESTPTIDEAAFTIAPMNGGYSIKNVLGKYISGTSNSNKLNVNDTPQLNTISVASTGNVTVTSNTRVLTYNTASGQNRFRYMGSNSGSIQLYKYTEQGGTPVEPVTITGLSKTGTLNKTTYNVGDKFDATGLIILANMSDGTTKDVTESVVWTPSTLALNTTSVTGTYTIDGNSYSITVTGIKVEPDVDLLSIAFTTSEKEMKVGESETLSVNYNPNNATNKTLQFSSSNEKVATVDNSGLLKAVGKGKTRITAVSTTNQNIATSMIVTVKGDSSGLVGGTWTRVSNASSLKAGDKVIIACEDKTVVAGNISTTFMAKIDTTFSSDKTTIPELKEGTAVLTLGGSVGAWTLANSEGKLLGSSAAKSVNWGSGTTTWDITIANNKATIQSTTASYGRFLYNGGSPRFTTYTSNTSTSMLLPSLYRLEGGTISDLDLLIDEITYANTCVDFTKANDYWDSYLALNSDDQTKFKATTMEDVDGSLNLYEKLVYMKTLNEQSNNTPSQNLSMNIKDNETLMVIIGVLGLITIPAIAYYSYQKRKYLSK